MVFRTDDGVAHAMTARVLLQIAAGGHPGRGPVLAILVVAQIDVAPAVIEWHVIVARPRDAAQTRIAIKGISAGGVGDDAVVCLAPQIVDPWQGCIRPRDDVLPVPIVKIAVLHRMLSSPYLLRLIKPFHHFVTNPAVVVGTFPGADEAGVRIFLFEIGDTIRT